jgi:hypothetical protein
VYECWVSAKKPQLKTTPFYPKSQSLKNKLDPKKGKIVVKIFKIPRKAFENHVTHHEYVDKTNKKAHNFCSFNL